MKTLTLKQYNKKYKRCLDKLLFYSKEEIKKFDTRFDKFSFKGKDYSHNLNKFLLNGRKFILIEDTYYEVPRRFSFIWFKNINRPTKVAAAAVLLAAVTFGTLKGLNLIGAQIPKYTLNLDCGEGFIGSDHVKVINNTAVIEVAPNPKRDGYVFDGWFKTREKRKNGDDEYIYKDKISFPYKITADTTMYAKWNSTIGESCSISFIDEGKEILNTLKVKKGTQVNPNDFEKPVKEDYKFNNWLDKDKKPVTEPFYIYENKVLNPSWTKEAFMITLNTNGGNQPEGSETISEGLYKLCHLKSLDYEPITNKADSTFMGWYLDEELENPVEFPLELKNDNVTLYAKWGFGKEYTVHFETNGGSDVEDKKCSHIAIPPTSTKEHYTLKGWSTDNTSAGIIDFGVAGGYKVYKNQTLYAIWEKSEFNVTLHHKDSTEIISNVGFIEKCPASPLLDFELVGWYKNDKLEGDPIDFSKGYKVTEDTHLYPKHERNAYKVNVKDGEAIIASYSSISTLTADLKPKISKPNQTAKFYVGSGETKKTIVFDGSEKIKTDLSSYLEGTGEDKNTLNVYCEWEVSGYDLTLIYDNDKAPVKEKVLSNKTKVVLSELETFNIEGYSFAGWSKTKGGEILTEGYDLTDNETLYGNYTQDLFKLDISYKCGDTELATSTTINNLAKGTYNTNIITKDDVITKDGVKYGFSEFKINTETVEGNTFEIEANSICVVEYNKFTDVEVYTKIGESKSDTPYATIKDQYQIDLDTLPSPGLDDYKIDHYEDIEGNKITGTVSACKYNKIYVVLTQQSFTVSLNCMGGSIAVDKIEHIKDGSTLSKSLIGTPSKGNYDFIGWYNDEACEDAFKFADDVNPQKITSNKTLYAKWANGTTVETTVKFTLSDADFAKGARFCNSEGVKVETNPIVLTKAEVGSIDYGSIVYDGHSINHWEENGQKVNFPITDTTEGQVHNLTAVFDDLAEACSVQLNAREGNFVSEETPKPKTKIFTPKIGEKFSDFKTEHASDIQTEYEDHEFAYWEIYDIQSGGYVQIQDDYVFNSNIFIYAHYVDKIEDDVTFAESNWATVSYYANKGYDALLAFFKKSESTLTSFIGKTKNLKYNGEDYKVAVIGEGHDYENIQGTASGQTCLTFNFMEVIPNECYGPSFLIESKPTNRWSTSLLRGKLNTTNEISELFDEQLTKNVKTVEKKTMNGGQNDDHGSYIYTKDKFFLLSGIELGYSTSSNTYKKQIFTDSTGGTGAEEGSAYSYFTGDTRRIKYLRGTETASEYWMRSPYNKKDDDTGHWNGAKGVLTNCVTTGGAIDTNFKHWYGDHAQGVAPAFALGVYKVS